MQRTTLRATPVRRVVRALLVTLAGIPIVPSPADAVVVTNQPPVAVDIAVDAIGSGAVRIAVLGSVSDPDGDVIMLDAITEPSHGEAVIDMGGTEIVFRAAPGFLGADSFTYRVTDLHGGTATANITIAVSSAPNAPPIVYAGGDRWAHAGTTMVLSGSAYDPEGGAVTYSWAPSDGLADANTATPTLTTSLDNPSDYVLTACDPGGTCATSTATITVTATPSAVLSLGAPQTVERFAEFAIPVTFAAPSGDDGPYSVNVTGPGTTFASLVDSTPAVVAVAASGSWQGTADMHVCVSSQLSGSLGCNWLPVSIANTAPSLQITPVAGAPAVSAPVVSTAAASASSFQITPVAGAPVVSTAAASALAVSAPVVSTAAASASSFQITPVAGAPADGTAAVSALIASVPTGPATFEVTASDVEDGTPPTIIATAFAVGMDAGASCAASWSAYPTHVSVSCTDDGTATLTVTAVDSDGAAITASASVDIANTAPVGTAEGSPNPVSAGEPDVLRVTGFDEANDTSTCTSILWSDGTFDPTCNPVHVFIEPVTELPTVVSFVDDDGATASVSVYPWVEAPLTLELVSSGSGFEGSLSGLHTSASSSTGAAIELTWAYEWTAGPAHPGSTCTIDDSELPYVSLSCQDDGTVSVTVTASDGTHTVSRSVSVVIEDQRSIIQAELSDSSPKVGQAVTLVRAAPCVGASCPTPEPPGSPPLVIDQGVNDPTTCVSVNWGDGSPETTCDAAHSYTTSGNYQILVKASDYSEGPDHWGGYRYIGTWVSPDYPPTAYNTYVSAHRGVPVQFTLTAYDANVDPFDYIVDTQPLHGTLSGVAPLLTYTPDVGYFGADSFLFSVTDGTRISTKTVFIMSHPNYAPHAPDASTSTKMDTPVTSYLNAYDQNFDTLTYGVVSQPAHGSVTLSGIMLRYTPDAGFTGQDTVVYSVTDGLETDTGVVTFEVRGSRVITNGVIKLGVDYLGQLNIDDGTRMVGLTYVPTGNEATAPGCLCEGWGVADAITERAAYANTASGILGLSVESFVSTPSTAVATTRADSIFRVTHDYHPSTSPNLYEVTVAIENISDAPVDLRYRRVMDWDVQPTAYNEFVTIERGNATELVFTSDNGFATANPLAGPSQIFATGEFTDLGPGDIGALFDFDFGILEPGAAKQFSTFYGAAASEIAALEALTAVGAEAYSLGQPNVPGGPDLGGPNTFIFAFGGIGGEPVFNRPPVAVADTASVFRNATVSIPTLSANDSDPDGDALVVASVGPASSGVVTLDDEGVIHYTPSAGFVGTDSFTYVISDGRGGASAAVVTVTVGNRSPVIEASPEHGLEGLPIELFATAADPDGDEVRLTATVDSSSLDPGATCVMSTTNGFSLVCNDDGFVVVTFAAFDGVDTSTFDVVVSISNVAPVLVSAVPNRTETTSSVTLTETFTDAGLNDTHRLTVDWGDGTPPTIVEPAVSPLSVSHSYTSIGAKTITSCVRDDDGAAAPVLTAFAVSVETSAVAVVNPGSCRVVQISVVNPVPNAPQRVSAAIAGSKVIRVSFIAPIPNGGTPVLSYTVTCRSPGAPTKVVTVPTSPISISGLTAGATYVCSVVATNAAGSGPAAAAPAIRIPTVPGPPRNVSAALNRRAREIGVSYAAPLSNGGSAITAYTATCTSSTAGAVTRSVSGLANPLVVSGATPGAAYRCSVRATNITGTGPASALSNQVVVPNVPGVPRLLSVARTTTSGQLRVALAPPLSNGGGAISRYTATCVSSNGGVTRSGSFAVTAIATSYHVRVSALTVGRTYRCAASATNISGTGPSSNISASTVVR